ncbi:MAG: metal-sulfur cluster assembly factor [Burkholderiaceae bacterium]
MNSLPDAGAVYDALREVDDPEAGMNIVELGLVYRVESVAARIESDMTMTTPACPVADMLVEHARLAVQRISPADTEVRVQLVWEPIWNPSMMSGTAREFFGWPG